MDLTNLMRPRVGSHSLKPVCYPFRGGLLSNKTSAFSLCISKVAVCLSSNSLSGEVVPAGALGTEARAIYLSFQSFMAAKNVSMIFNISTSTFVGCMRLPCLFNFVSEPFNILSHLSEFVSAMSEPLRFPVLVFKLCELLHLLLVLVLGMFEFLFRFVVAIICLLCEQHQLSKLRLDRTNRVGGVPTGHCIRTEGLVVRLKHNVVVSQAWNGMGF